MQWQGSPNSRGETERIPPVSSGIGRVSASGPHQRHIERPRLRRASSQKGKRLMSTEKKQGEQQTGANVVVKALEQHDVKWVFGVPGAKIDKVFDTLVDSSIETVVCRHEQNAAFIAGGIGRMTGKAGVVLVTSGPGCSNLVTGLATANSEGDPVVAIGGAVPIANRLKQVHQSMDTISLFRPITKFSAEIDSPESVSE